VVARAGREAGRGHGGLSAAGGEHKCRAQAAVKTVAAERDCGAVHAAYNRAPVL
jgi:hypothetical protein